MPPGTKWLNLTLPAAAFLGSAAGSVAVQQYFAHQAPPPPAVVALGVPTKVMPERLGTPDDQPPLDPDAAGHAPPAPGPPRSDGLPPPPTPGGDGAPPPTDPMPAPGGDEAASDPLDSMAELTREIEQPLPPGYFDLPPTPTGPNAPPILQPGLIITVEVLEALPGRPISGERLIRGDGSISLGFYGDLPVAGLNRYQAKVRLLEHLHKFLTNSCLGLRIMNRDGKVMTIPPVESDRVFVYDTVYSDPKTAQPVPPAPDSIPVGLREEVHALSAKLDQILKQNEHGPAPKPAAGKPGEQPSSAPPREPVPTPPAPAEAGAKPSA